jgi:RNA polymerase sigma factor (sigma-70 family)
MGASPIPAPLGFNVGRSPGQSVTTSSLVDEARSGDVAALGRVCATVYPRLLAFYRYSGAGTDAEDLAADAVEAIVAGLPTLRESAAFDAWTWSIGRRKLQGWIRRKPRRRPVELIAPDPAGPAELAVLAEEHRAVSEALGTLRDRDRTLLWLREVEGLSYAEIGGRTGAATGATRVACHRARRRLEDAYRRKAE